MLIGTKWYLRLIDQIRPQVQTYPIFYWVCRCRSEVHILCKVGYSMVSEKILFWQYRNFCQHESSRSSGAFPHLGEDADGEDLRGWAMPLCPQKGQPDALSLSLSFHYQLHCTMVCFGKHDAQYCNTMWDWWFCHFGWHINICTEGNGQYDTATVTVRGDRLTDRDKSRDNWFGR